MKSIFNIPKKIVALTHPVKYGVKITNAPKNSERKITDTSSIALENLLSNKSKATNQANSLAYTIRNNFSNLPKNSTSFYTSVTGKPIDVTSDYVFKGIFSDEARTKDFSENILVGEGKILPPNTQIEHLQYLKRGHIWNFIMLLPTRISRLKTVSLQ